MRYMTVNLLQAKTPFSDSAVTEIVLHTLAERQYLHLCNTNLEGHVMYGNVGITGNTGKIAANALLSQGKLS